MFLLFVRVPDFRWSPKTARFRGPNGRFLDAARVRRLVDAARRAHAVEINTLTQQLMARQVSLAEWERRMRQEIKNIHIYSALAARGGKSQLTPTDLGRVGALVKRQYRYLARFAQEIATLGGFPPRTSARAAMYVAAGRGTYEVTRERLLVSNGFDEERNILNPAAESCQGANSCVEQTAMGWVKAGTLVRIGGRLCLSHCQCSIERRNSQTGEIAA